MHSFAQLICLRWIPALQCTYLRHIVSISLTPLSAHPTYWIDSMPTSASIHPSFCLSRKFQQATCLDASCQAPSSSSSIPQDRTALIHRLILLQFSSGIAEVRHARCPPARSTFSLFLICYPRATRQRLFLFPLHESIQIEKPTQTIVLSPFFTCFSFSCRVAALPPTEHAWRYTL